MITRLFFEQRTRAHNKLRLIELAAYRRNGAAVAFRRAAASGCCQTYLLLFVGLVRVRANIQT